MPAIQISTDLLTTKTGILKLINAGIIFVSMCLFYSAIKGVGTPMFVSSSIICGLFFLVMILLVYIIDGHNIQKTPFETIGNGYLAIIFLLTAICCWTYINSALLVITGICCFASAILFALDASISAFNAELISTNYIQFRNPFTRNQGTPPAPDQSHIGQPVDSPPPYNGNSSPGVDDYTKSMESPSNQPAIIIPDATEEKY